MFHLRKPKTLATTARYKQYGVKMDMEKNMN